MSKQLRELQARKASLVKEARSITDIAAGEDRELNDEEVTSFDALKTRINTSSIAIDREVALIAEEARLATSAAIGPIVTDHRENDPMHGFANGKVIRDEAKLQAPVATGDLVDATGFTTYTSGGTATPVQWTKISNVKSYSGFDGSASEIE
jgi:HK97 family phage major capsid protein